MHRIFFQIGNFPVYTYAVFVVLGFTTGLLVAAWLAGKEKIPSDTVIELAIFILIGGILGARLVYVLVKLPDYLSAPLDILNLRKGGLSWHGALLGGLFLAYLFAKSRKLSLKKICDILSAPAVLGLAIGRIGCLLNGCCYGKISTVKWAVDLSAAGVIGKRHPTQIYEMILNIAVFLLILFWLPRKKFDGEVFLGMLSLYSAVRFFVEFFREEPLLWFGLTLAQFVSIAVIIICGWIIYAGRRRALKTNY
ncbi:MAG: prolipoprotein diacylglyceryl transferase [Firmicutes bacterium]|nr:prolipoprotein diacylglyceryl transferase [Bacillota bacterium]